MADLDRPCPGIDRPHVCCNGPRDCGGTVDWCEHCAPGAFDKKGRRLYDTKKYDEYGEPRNRLCRWVRRFPWVTT